MTTILFAIDPSQKILDYLRNELGDRIRTIVPDDFEESTLRRHAAEADMVIGPRHLAAVLDAGPNIRLVQIPWAGVEDFVPTVRAHPGVHLANSHGNAYATAQYAVTLLLALVNRIVPAHRLVAQGRWQDRRELFGNHPLMDKTVGIVGAGHIGTWAARLLKPFGPDLWGLKRTAPEETPEPFDRMVGVDGLRDLLDASDAVILSAPHTPDTENLIGRDELERLGPEGYLVNIARGEVVEQRPLYEALRDGRIMGAALDVWYNYRPEPDAQGRAYPFDEPFHELDNVVLSPHRAGGMASFDPERWQPIVENIRRVIDEREEFVNEVDLEAGY